MQIAKAFYALSVRLKAVAILQIAEILRRNYIAAVANRKTAFQIAAERENVFFRRDANFYRKRHISARPAYKLYFAAVYLHHAVINRCQNFSVVR